VNLKELLSGLPIDVSGVAEIGDLEKDFDPSLRRGVFKRAVLIGLRLHEGILRTIEDRPTLPYKHHYKTLNWLLDQRAFEIARRLESQGHLALAVAASQTVDWETQRGALSHKAIGVKAGLGWIGKSGLLIHPVYGPRVRYATVLTDAEIEGSPDPGILEGCGTCMECARACPAGAIGEQGYDREACLKKLREFASIRGIGQFICGVCIRACPVGMNRPEDP
jgi:epoxyqueuosine reductase QueG